MLLPEAGTTYISTKDSDYVPDLENAEDFSDAVFMLSVNDDEFSYVIQMTFFKSIASQETAQRSSALKSPDSKKGKKLYSSNIAI
eukprot:8188408-Ditylum_brightwellii.AAC.1